LSLPPSIVEGSNKQITPMPPAGHQILWFYFNIYKIKEVGISPCLL